MPIVHREIFTAIKDPNDSLDYVIEYDRWLKTGRTITASVWTQTVGVDALTLSLDTFTTTETKVRVGGGTVDETYRVTNRITLDDGQIKDTSIELTIEER